MEERHSVDAVVAGKEEERHSSATKEEERGHIAKEECRSSNAKEEGRKSSPAPLSLRRTSAVLQPLPRLKKEERRFSAAMEEV